MATAVPFGPWAEDLDDVEELRGFLPAVPELPATDGWYEIDLRDGSGRLLGDP